jgi:hypothetical protein
MERHPRRRRNQVALRGWYETIFMVLAFWRRLLETGGI